MVNAHDIVKDYNKLGEDGMIEVMRLAYIITMDDVVQWVELDKKYPFFADRVRVFYDITTFPKRGKASEQVAWMRRHEKYMKFSTREHLNRIALDTLDKESFAAVERDRN